MTPICPNAQLLGAKSGQIRPRRKELGFLKNVSHFARFLTTTRHEVFLFTLSSIQKVEVGPRRERNRTLALIDYTTN